MITEEAWNEKHPDFKTVDEDGQRYLLRLDPETGATVLEPVRVEAVDPKTEEHKR